MPDEKPPKPPPEPEEKVETEEEVEGDERDTLAMVTRTLAHRELERLAGHCFDMGSALRKKAKAVDEGNLRADILAAHEFNEAARQLKHGLAAVDRSHKRFLEANPEVE